MVARHSKHDRDRLIIGLGNPEEGYKNTYHNIGAVFVNYISQVLGGGNFKKARTFEYEKLGDLILLKPLVYMNESGIAVSAAIKYFSAKSQKTKGVSDIEIEPANILIAHDDSDLTIGKFKLSVGQGPAGHHGIESVINTIGTNDFARLRIGIRPITEIKRKKAGDFVLKPINPANMIILESVFQDAADEASLI